MPENSPVHHYSLTSPIETDRADLPSLLRRLADDLEDFGAIDVLDLTMGTRVSEEEGFVHHITVYFKRCESTEEVGPSSDIPGAPQGPEPGL